MSYIFCECDKTVAQLKNKAVNFSQQEYRHVWLLCVSV